MVESEMIAPETIPNPTASASTDIAYGFPAGDLTQTAEHRSVITDTPHSGLLCHLVGYIKGELIPCQESRNSRIEGGYLVFGRVSKSRPVCARTTGTLVPSSSGKGYRRPYPTRRRGFAGP